MQSEQRTEELRLEVERLTRLLDESREVQHESAEQAEELARTAAFDAAEVERLRNELKLFKEDASRFSREDDRRIRRLEREKQEDERRIKRLKSEVGELRAVIKQYVGEIQNGFNGTSRSALHSELDLVRERAETDLNRMREQLEASQLNDSADAAELEQLRRELEAQQQAANGQSEALERALAQQARLGEEIEARNDEVHRLQRALESAQEEGASIERQRRAQADARKQAERALGDAQQEIDRLKRRGESRPAAEVPVAAGMRGAAAWRVLAAALAAFLVADGIALFSGKGELLSGLLAGPDDPPPVLSPPRQEPGTRTTAPAKAEKPSASKNKDVANDGTATAAMQQEQPPDPAIAAGREPKAQAAEPPSGSPLRDRLSSGGEGPMMAYVRGGTFDMGQQRDSLAMDEQPVRAVTVASFAIGRYEVTFAEYLAFARATGRRLPEDGGWGRGRRPVINVTWQDAKAYTRWLSRQSGRRYRLPTESEWEFAARAGSDSFYWWGYELEENRANCFNCGSRWDGKSTAPVGSFAANGFQLHDTAGNVMEWVQDCYRDSYRGAPSDGTAREYARCGERVARGGAYNKPGESLYTTRRFHFREETRLPTLGFRVVREL